jgi:hypothetical protein
MLSSEQDLGLASGNQFRAFCANRGFADVFERIFG